MSVEQFTIHLRQKASGATCEILVKRTTEDPTPPPTPPEPEPEYVFRVKPNAVDLDRTEEETAHVTSLKVVGEEESPQPWSADNLGEVPDWMGASIKGDDITITRK